MPCFQGELPITRARPNWSRPTQRCRIECKEIRQCWAPAVARDIVLRAQVAERQLAPAAAAAEKARQRFVMAPGGYVTANHLQDRLGLFRTDITLVGIRISASQSTRHAANLHCDAAASPPAATAAYRLAPCRPRGTSRSAAASSGCCGQSARPRALRRRRPCRGAHFCLHPIEAGPQASAAAM